MKLPTDPAGVQAVSGLTGQCFLLPEMLVEILNKNVNIPKVSLEFSHAQNKCC